MQKCNLAFGVQSILLVDFSWTLYVILGIVGGAQKSLPQVPFGYSSSENLGWCDLLSAAVCQSQSVAKSHLV